MQFLKVPVEETTTQIEQNMKAGSQNFTNAPNQYKLPALLLLERKIIQNSGDSALKLVKQNCPIIHGIFIPVTIFFRLLFE